MLNYAFSWLKNINDKTKESTKKLTGFCYSYPTRDIILDIKETAKALCDIRPDVDPEVAMDTAITLVEQRVSFDLSAFKAFLLDAGISTPKSAEVEQ